jgi:TolB-like protein
MSRIFSILSLLILSVTATFAQNKEKTDVLIKINGDQMKGRVKEMDDAIVKFVYPGESLVYTIKKEDINKIIFASGREEVFNQPIANTTSKEVGVAPVDHKNKIAILPFGYVADGQPSNEEMGLKVQNECYSMLSKHSGENKVIDIHTTNALLLKAGVNRQTIAGYTMDELANILGVEYVLSGMVTLTKTSQTSYSSNNQNSTSKKSDNNKKNNSSTYGNSYATVEQNYNTSLNLDIFNDKGESIFSQNREAFWHMQDAYKSTLEYLLKRCPLYKK